MNPDTGEIREFISEEEASANGFTVPIRDMFLKAKLEAMTPEERVVWAKKQQHANRAQRRRAKREAKKERGHV
jgi:hypothetical protein